MAQRAIWQRIEALDLEGEDVTGLARWAASVGEDRRRLWQECPRPEWLLALAVAAGVERSLWQRAACDCVREAVFRLDADEVLLDLLVVAEHGIAGELEAEDRQAAQTEARERVNALGAADDDPLYWATLAVDEAVATGTLATAAFAHRFACSAVRHAGRALAIASAGGGQPEPTMRERLLDLVRRRIPPAAFEQAIADD
jgi:hypothetical protein